MKSEEEIMEQLLKNGVELIKLENSDASINVLQLSKATERCYKIELIVTMDNEHPEQDVNLDDILFNALEDAPFFMDSVTINKIGTEPCNTVQEKYDELKDVNTLLCVLKENREDDLIEYVKDCYMHKETGVNKKNDTKNDKSYYVIFPPFANEWNVYVMDYYTGIKTVYSSEGKTSIRMFERE